MRSGIVFEAGTYYMRNMKSDSVIDLHGGDQKTLIGFPYHGLENQQWEFGPLGDGWYIRSVHTGSYFTLEKSLGEDAPVTTNHYPVSWVVEPVESEEATNVVRILWPHTNLSLDLFGGQPGPGGKIRLGSHAIGQKQQLWRLERVPDKPKQLDVSAGSRGQEDEDGETTTTAFSTTTDKVTTITVTTTTVVKTVGAQR